MAAPDPIQRPGPILPGASPASERPSPPSGGEFGKILAELQRLGRQAAPEEQLEAGAVPDTLDPPALLKRLEEAGDSFQRLMEIRSRLEEAWRKGRNVYGKEGPG